MNKLFIGFSFLLSLTVNAQLLDEAILDNINTAKSLIESDVPAALELANSIFVSSRDLGFDEGIAESYIIIGRCCIQTGDIAAQKALNVALKYAEKIKDKKLISDCYFYLGRSCFINGDTRSQLDYYKKAFEIRKELNDQKLLADSYHAYGNVYLLLIQDSLAEGYYIQAKNIRAMLNDQSGLASISNNLALLAERRGDTALYRSLMYESIQMNEETGNKRNLATNHGNLGVSFYKLGIYDSAWYHSNLSFEIRKKNDFKDHLAGTYPDLGDILFAQKKYTEALSYYKQGAELAESIKGNEGMMENYSALAKTYAVLDSQELHLKYKAMADKLIKEHEGDTLLSKSIPLPAAFDFKEPERGSESLWWALGAIVVLGLGVFGLYRKRKK